MDVEVDLWMAITVLDAQLQRAVAGEEETLLAVMIQRAQLIAGLEPQSLTGQQWAELQDWTWSLQTKFTHWRRLLIQDFALTEKHARFVANQDDSPVVGPSRQFRL